MDKSVPERPKAANDAGSGAAEREIPLVLDLDHTLLRTDTLYETFLAYLKQNPLRLFLVFFWVWQGRPTLKRRLGESAELDVEGLPINEDVIDLARAAHASGRRVIIATAADESVAKKVAARLDIPVDVRASDGVKNLKGKTKAEALAAEFPQGFDYAGDSRADLAVWEVARKAILVGASSGTRKRAAALGNVDAVIPGRSTAKALIKAMVEKRADFCACGAVWKDFRRLGMAGLDADIRRDRFRGVGDLHSQ